MKFLIQRVIEANVKIDDEIVGEIRKGILVLVGISNEDTAEIADKMVRKLIGLRIFEDSEGKTNLDLKTVNGELLMISQFTLYADCKKGNRPSFINAGTPIHANKLYEYILELCNQQYGIQTAQGRFGADMKVHLINDGPFTIILDSRDL